MSGSHDLDDLVSYIERSSGLDPHTARRIVDDVMSYLTESPQAFAQRRHAVLLRLGYRNEQIYVQLARELADRRFPPPPFSLRQIRRLIYG